MKIEVINKSTNSQICIADVIFGLDNLIVLRSEGIEKDKLERFLMKRAEIKNYSYTLDDKILCALNLQNRKYQFGRMSEACCLYALLNYFQSDDDFLVYPLKDEVISMIDIDIRYSNVYLWKSRKEQHYALNA